MGPGNPWGQELISGFLVWQLPGCPQVCAVWSSCSYMFCFASVWCTPCCHKPKHRGVSYIPRIISMITTCMRTMSKFEQILNRSNQCGLRNQPSPRQLRAWKVVYRSIDHFNPCSILLVRHRVTIGTPWQTLSKGEKNKLVPQKNAQISSRDGWCLPEMFQLSNFSAPFSAATIYLSIYLSILSIYLSVLSIYLSIYLCIYIYVNVCV